MFHYEKKIGLTDDYFFWKKDDADDERQQKRPEDQLERIAGA